MAQQQILLTILGFVLVGITIGVALWLFSANAATHNKLEIINDLNNIRSAANKYRFKPNSMAGGSGLRRLCQTGMQNTK